MADKLNQLLPYNDKLEIRDLSTIEMVVIHCTELPDIDSARVYGEKIHYDSGTGNSGHYYIGKSGKTYQWVTDNHIAHHVKDNNQKTIGIELDNLGRYPHWHQTNHQIMHDDYPDTQIKSLIKLLKTLKKNIPSLKYICGHEDLDTRLIKSDNEKSIYIRRKMDPGKMFPWSKVMKKINLTNIGCLGTNIGEKA